MKKLFVVCCLLMMASLMVFAGKITISSYEFDIQGKTQEFSVRNLVEPKGEEVFDSEDALRGALEGKRQTLVNKRVFKDVSYDYVLVPTTGEDSFAEVTFHIVSAKTLLIFPAFKYDTNTGTNLGFRLFDTNTFGTLANTTLKFTTTWSNTDKEDVAFFPDVQISNYVVGKTTLNMTASGSYSKKWNYYTSVGTFSISNIPVWKYGWNVNGKFNTSSVVNDDSSQKTYYEFGSSLTGMKAGSVYVSPSMTGYLYDYNRTGSYLYPIVSTSGWKVGGVSISTSDYLKIYNKNAKAYDNWKVTTISHTTSFGFDYDALRAYSYSNTITFTVPAEGVWPYSVYNTLNHRLSGQTTVHYYSDFHTQQNKLTSIDFGLGLTQYVNIADKIGVTPHYEQRLVYDTNTKDFSKYHVISASAGQNTINWNGNFREGYSYSFTLSEAWNRANGNSTARYIRDHFEFTWFDIVYKYFNPTVRFIMNHSLESSYGYIKYSDTNSKTTEYLRGIRNVFIEADPHVFTAVASFSVLTKFPMPHMFDFVDCYVNPFFDFGMVQHTTSDKMKKYYGVGMEAIGILKEYPSYPVRVSVGLDVDHLKAWLFDNGPRDFYEIYIGLGMFY